MVLDWCFHSSLLCCLCCPDSYLFWVLLLSPYPWWDTAYIWVYYALSPWVWANLGLVTSCPLSIFIRWGLRICLCWGNSPPDFLYRGIVLLLSLIFLLSLRPPHLLDLRLILSHLGLLHRRNVLWLITTVAYLVISNVITGRRSVDFHILLPMVLLHHLFSHCLTSSSRHILYSSLLLHHLLLHHFLLRCLLSAIGDVLTIPTFPFSRLHWTCTVGSGSFFYSR